MKIAIDYNIISIQKAYDYEKADWFSFKKILNNEIDLNCFITKRSEVGYHTKNLCNFIIESTEVHIPFEKTVKIYVNYHLI